LKESEKKRRKVMKQRFVLFILVIASLIATQCGGTPPATEAPTATEVPPTEAPPTEAPTATEVPPTEAPPTEAPTATEVPPTEAPTATEVPPTEAPAATEAPPTEVPVTLDGQSLLQERCTVCHDLGRVERSEKTEEEWKATVERMVGKGAQLDEAEQEVLIKYLAETYPKAAEVPPTEAPATLDGQSLLQERCTVCHDLGRVERSKKTEEEWKATVERMVGKGAQLDEAEQELVIKYLAETYPK
jgi:cytochrome c5